MQNEGLRTRGRARTIAIALVVAALASIVLLLRRCPTETPEPREDVEAKTTSEQHEPVPAVPRASPNAAESPPSKPESEPRPEPLQHFTLRNGRDGSALTGFTLRFISEGTSDDEVISDSSGSISVSAQFHGRTIIPPEPWSVLAPVAELPADTDELWLWRPRIALVTVRGGEGSTVDPASVSLFTVPGGSFSPGPASRATPPPGNTQWLRKRGLQASRLQGTPVDTSAWRVEVPDVQGVCVVGFAPGWRPAVERLPDAPPDQEVSLVLILRPTQWVTGHLRSSDGLPLANARLVLYSTRNGRYEDASEEHLSALGLDRGAFGASWSRSQDSSEQMFMSSCTTADDGSFRMDIRHPGRVLVIAYAQDHCRVVSELGAFEGHREIDLVAPSKQAPDTLFIELDGARVKSAAFVIADMGYDDEQPAFDVESDSDGRILCTWLDIGRRYALIPAGSPVPPEHRRPHFFTHADRATLDLAAMSTKWPGNHK